MLAWSEGTDNGRQKTRNHGYDVIVGGELFTDYSDHPRKLVTLNPKPGINRRRTLPAFSRWWDAYRKQLTERLLRKVRRWQWLRSGALPMIDRSISIRQSTVAAISGLHCRALVNVLPEQLGGWQPDCKIQWSGRNGQRLMYEQSHRDYLRLLSASSSACHGPLIITG